MKEMDLYLFKEGTHRYLYKHLGSFIQKNGVFFRVWAPHAKNVSVMGDFNNWDRLSNPLTKNGEFWEGFVEGAKKRDKYKYFIIGAYDQRLEKIDPFAKYFEKPPKSASVIWEDNYKFNDEKWLEKRNQNFDKPFSIYEVHLGSWNKEYDNYVELAGALSKYVKEMGYTHIELMPLTEYPFDGSWGYQAVGYFAPTARYGEPHEFKKFVDIMHQNDIGIILDWVPSHFAVDGHGLITYDGTALFEHPSPLKGYHPEWKSHIFDYEKGEVRSFLISSAIFWLKEYHIDAIRVDAVASMIYLDYARDDWIPNKYGGNENLEAIHFLKTLNKSCYEEVPGITMIAEESTAFPAVTKPEGLGFGYKWNMGWMNDTLQYFEYEPIYRQYHHHELTFSFVYMFSENYILPLSHDEVVHGKKSLIGKMPGNYEEKFANLRALFAYMYAHPGKKLLFMGGEIAQFKEWAYKESIEWFLLKYEKHKGVQNLVKELNKIYKNEKALWLDCNQEGFEWINELDYQRNVISFIRKNKNEKMIIVCNFSGAKYQNYLIGAPNGEYKEILNSNSKKFGGWIEDKERIYKTFSKECCGREYSIELDLEPFSVVYLKKII
ncbi:1,4-alpha-glucan branching protein GlgB [Lebetimonas sp. JS032]|uniref:1,4-alpha-glucan branching protein GlgB n=1 Tax=Lebetimonas sp. JS032 TaxID=990070 RepID=UPI000465F98F|nr:1,4-alpha-glucan branching protein GlgB [Lebetimonas sp. JS032]